MIYRLLVNALCLLVLMAAIPSAAQTSFSLYVSPAGNDSGPGTMDRPFKTIQHAANMAKPGTTVYIREGSYCARLRVTQGGNQEKGFVTFQNLTSQSLPGGRPILDGSCLTVAHGDDALVELVDVSFVRIQGLEIRNFRTAEPESVPWGIRVAGGGSHIEILKNNVHHIEQNSAPGPKNRSNGVGIGVYGTDARLPISDLVIDGNEVHHLKTGHSESLVVNGNVSGFRIARNIVHDNSNIGIDVIGFERTAPDPSVDRARDGVVSENRVYDITARGYLGDGPNSDGIYVDGGTRILIERNIVHDVDFGIEMASEHADGDTSHVIARNNLVYSCHAAAFAIGGYDAKRGRTEDVSIVNNTIYKNDTWATGSGEFLMQYYLARNLFQNNIVYVGDHGKLMTSSSGVAGGVQTVAMDHNLYYSPAGAGALSGSFDGKPFEGFDEYIKLTRNDRNSVFADPKFVDPGFGDFRLKPESPARRKGEDLGPGVVGSEDLEGRPRAEGERIDIGCYQMK